MTKSIQSFVKNFLKYALGFIVLGYVIYANWEPKNGGQGIKNLLAQTPDFSLLALTFLLTGVTVSCQIIRWYFLVRSLDLPFSVRNAFRLGMVGYFYNTLLPGSIGGDFLKAYFISKEHPEQKAAAVSTVLVDRILGLFGLLLFAAAVGGGFWFAGDPVIVGNDYLTNIIRVCALLVAAIIVGWVVLGFVSPTQAEKIGTRLRGVRVVGRTAAEVWGAMYLYRRRPKLLYLTLPLTAFGQFLMILNLHVAVRVYPCAAPASFLEHFVVGPIGFIAQAFWPAPGGVGGAEYVFGKLYEFLSRPEETGKFGRFTMRFAEITLGAAGYVVYLSMKAELPAPAEAEEAKEPAATT